MTSSSKPSRRRRLSGLRHDLKHAARLGWVAWGDILRAIVELAIARLRLGTRETRELLRRPQARKGPVPESTPGRDASAIVDRVAFAIPRFGRRVPWRADCLVQALAAMMALSAAVRSG